MELISSRYKANGQIKEFFLKTTSGGLSDVDLTAMLETFEQSGKIACFVAVRPTFSLHLVEMNVEGKVTGIRATQETNLWINGGGLHLSRRKSSTMRDARGTRRRTFKLQIVDSIPGFQT